MRIEAVVISVDYADYLAETLPHVLPHVDDMVVVTNPDDGRTIGLCHKMGVRCLQTRCFYQWGDDFNKARGINYGLMHLRRDDWVVHIDADIALPLRTRWMLNCSMLDPNKIYGVDRFNIVGRRAWDEFKSSGAINHHYESSCRVQPPGDDMGSRLTHFGFGGYCPIGYFQLWHPKVSGVDIYPDTCDGTAERCDVLHALQWEREHRALIPEVIAMHLMTRDGGPGHQGANWRGRSTPEFSVDERPYGTPQRPAKAEAKAESPIVTPESSEWPPWPAWPDWPNWPPLPPCPPRPPRPPKPPPYY